MSIENLLIACTTCANTFREGGGDAAGWAIILMVCIIMPMAAGIVFFIARIARREALSLEPELRDQ